MRKVCYQRWIPAVKEKTNIDPGWKTADGTGCFSEPCTGYFHCWGTKSTEFTDGAVIDTIAVVEDCITGHVHQIDPDKVRFVQPPETKTHSKETARVEIVNAEDVGKRVMEVLAPVLESINRKLMSL